jgi:hypothetical protein
MGAPSGTVTFLFTDIEGSTRLWQLDEGAMRKAVQRHDELLRATSLECGGVVVSTMGDGFAVAFTSAHAALRAAELAPERLSQEQWSTTEPVRARVGLRSGEAEERDGDYFGTAVNRAARLMAIAHGGQVVCSSTTAELVEDSVTLVDLGEHRLRDLDRPMVRLLIEPGSDWFGSAASPVLALVSCGPETHKGNCPSRATQNPIRRAWHGPGWADEGRDFLYDPGPAVPVRNCPSKGGFRFGGTAGVASGVTT